jgi:hypothetical protein
MFNKADLSPGEYDPYFKQYISLVKSDATILSVLSDHLDQSIFFVENINKPLEYRYQEGKWSIGQVLMHNIDTERVFAYRALRFLRGEPTPLEGFNQDIFSKPFEDYAFAKADILRQLKATRQATITLYENATRDQLNQRGIASGKVLSVRAIPFLVIGHHLHHENIIAERYLKKV